MRSAILHSAEAFGALAERWDALASATDAGLFLSHRWLSAWWRAFHGVDELWVFVAEDDDGDAGGGLAALSARAAIGRAARGRAARRRRSGRRGDVRSIDLVRAGTRDRSVRAVRRGAARRARLGRARCADVAARARRSDGACDRRRGREVRSLGAGGARVRRSAGAERVGRVRARASAAAIGRRRRVRDGRDRRRARPRGALAPVAQGVGGARGDVAGGRSAGGQRSCTRWCPSCTRAAFCASASSASKGRAPSPPISSSPTAIARCSFCAAPIPSISRPASPSS